MCGKKSDWMKLKNIRKFLSHNGGSGGSALCAEKIRRSGKQRDEEKKRTEKMLWDRTATISANKTENWPSERTSERKKNIYRTGLSGRSIIVSNIVISELGCLLEKFVNKLEGIEYNLASSRFSSPSSSTQKHNVFSSVRICDCGCLLSLLPKKRMIQSNTSWRNARNKHRTQLTAQTLTHTLSFKQ